MTLSSLRVPRLHVMTDDSILAQSDFLDRVSRLVESLPSGDSDIAFHLRGPGTSTRTLWDLGWELRARLRPAGIPLLVNDRADLARAMGADGVHLPARGLPSAWVRGWVGEGGLFGRSFHSPAEGDSGEFEALHYGLVGNLWSTSSHPGRPGAGPGRLMEFRRVLEERNAQVNLIGIGGVTLGRLAQVREAGGDGVAVRGAFWNADEPERVVADFLAELAHWTPRIWKERGGYANG